jgi:rRNA maturation endonuclease Nob1
MGNPEYPSWKVQKKRLRKYKCRICDRTFRDWYLPEGKRICPRCIPLEVAKKEEVKNGD